MLCCPTAAFSPRPKIERSILGVRTRFVGGEDDLRDCIYRDGRWTSYVGRGLTASGGPGPPPLGSGTEKCKIERAIIDKNVHVGDGVRHQHPMAKPEHFDGPNFYVRDGLVVIPKNAIVPDGSVI